VSRARVLAMVLAWSIVVVKYGSKSQPIYSVRKLDRPADEAPGGARERVWP
jgi:hypothetical protein